MSTLAEFYPGTEVRCPHCLYWAPASDYKLVGEEGFECPSCEAVDLDSIPQTRPDMATSQHLDDDPERSMQEGLVDP